MQGAHRIHHRAHRVQVFSERVSSSRFHHKVRSLIGQSATDGPEGTTGINHIVDSVKGSDEVEFGILRERSGRNSLKLDSVGYSLLLCVGAGSLQGFFTHIKPVKA